jgi:hypothetical protein
MNTHQSALAKLASTVRDPVASLKSFALPDRRLFPLDDASLTKASAAAFEKEAKKLPVSEKIACARAITKAAQEQKVDNRGLAAKLASTEISPLFNTFMNMRAESTAWHPEAVREINTLKDLAVKIAGAMDIGLKVPLLSKLAGAVDDFDKKWDRGGFWGERGLPDAAYSVFGTTLDQQEFLPAPPDHVKVASRAVCAHDLADEIVSKAENVLGKEKIAKLTAAADRLAEFATWDHPHQEILVSFMPEVRR